MRTPRSTRSTRSRLPGRLAALVLAALVSAAARPAAAQAASEGLWVELGLGPGWARIACDICDAGRATGVSGHLALGGQLGSRVRVGAEVDAWTSRADGVPERLVGLAAIATWRPAPGRPLRAKVGVAYVTYRVDDDVDVVTASGIGPILGVAYEWRVSPRVGLGPYASLMIGTLGGQVSFNGAEVQDAANLNLLHLGFHLSWR
jgi:hypothetical protein